MRRRGKTNLDSILSQHGAMQLDGRQAQFLCDLGVLDLASLVERHPLDVLGDEGGRGDGGSTTCRGNERNEQSAS